MQNIIYIIFENEKKTTLYISQLIIKFLLKYTTQPANKPTEEEAQGVKFKMHTVSLFAVYMIAWIIRQQLKSDNDHMIAVNHYDDLS